MSLATLLGPSVDASLELSCSSEDGLVGAIFSLSRTLDIRTYGAVAGTSAGNASVVNRGALTTALNAALPGDTVLVGNGSYYCRGGLAVANLRSVTLQLDGTLVAAPEYDDWPLGDGSNYDGFLTFSNADNLMIRGAAGPAPPACRSTAAARAGGIARFCHSSSASSRGSGRSCSR